MTVSAESEAEEDPAQAGELRRSGPRVGRPSALWILIAGVAGLASAFILTVEKIELLARGEVRRARLFYLRDLRGKAARIKSQAGDDTMSDQSADVGTEAPASAAAGE